MNYVTITIFLLLVLLTTLVEMTEQILDVASGSFWAHHRSDLPQTLKYPEVLLDQNGHPRYRLADSMGNVHELRDGGVLRDARFENYCLAGIRLREVDWNHIAWDGCDLDNLEIDGNLARVSITGGSPGLVIRDGAVSDLYVAKGTPGSILRFSNCKMSDILLSRNKIAFELSRCVVRNLRIQNTEFIQPSVIQRSHVTKFEVTECNFDEVNLKDVSWTNGIISHSTFTNGKWVNTDISLTENRCLHFASMEVTGLRTDGTSWRSCRWDDSIAKQVEWNHCNVMAFEWYGGRMSLVMKHTSCDGLVFWRAGMSVAAEESRISGLRANDGAVHLSGRQSRLTNPVFRRSHVMGTLADDVIICHAEANSSLISADIGGVWVNGTGGPASTAGRK